MRNIINDYKIGEEFHNSNGETYIFIYINYEKDKALLVRKEPLKNNKPFYIGAYGIRDESWSQGHYFMDDLVSAYNYVRE